MVATSTGATEHLFGEIHYAAKKGDVIRVWALVNKAKAPVDAVTSSDSTALHLAAWKGPAVVSVRPRPPRKPLGRGTKRCTARRLGRTL